MRQGSGTVVTDPMHDGLREFEKLLRTRGLTL